MRRANLLALTTLLAACDVDPSDVSEGSAAPPTSDDARVARPAPVFARETDGTVYAVHAPAAGHSLFLADARGDFSVGLTTFVRDHASSLGLAPTTDPTSRTLSHRRRIGGLEMHRFRQTYRGFRLLGAAAEVTVVADGASARSIVGQLVDGSQTWAGVRRRMDTATAAATLRRVVAATWPGRTPTIGPVETVAIPSRRSLGFAAAVHVGPTTWEVVIDAVTGALLDTRELPPGPLEPFADEIASPVTVRASSFYTPFVFPQAWGEDVIWCVACVQHPGMAYTPFPGGGFRMGNHRVRIFDWDQDIDTMPRVVARPYGDDMFDAFPGHPDWDSQELLHKAMAALGVADPYHQDGWDYEESCQSLLCDSDITPPITLHASSPVTDHNGELGRSLFPYQPTIAPNPTEAEIEAWRIAVVEPWADALDVDHRYEPQAHLHLGNDELETLFHEIGHYYDLHNAAGPLRPPHAGPCEPGVMEGGAMGETLADMFSTAIVAELYPNADYTHPRAMDDEACRTVQGNAPVHHPDCDTEPNQFTDDRPAPSCSTSTGYDVLSIQQATWEFTTGQECGAMGCAPVVQHPASLVPAMLAAWGAGNFQSPESLFAHMRDELHAQDPAEAQRFQRIFTHHGVTFPGAKAP
jgi:hypothetical protein